MLLWLTAGSEPAFTHARSAQKAAIDALAPSIQDVVHSVRARCHTLRMRECCSDQDRWHDPIITGT